MFRKNATITNWKNIANVKHLILIGRGLDVYSRLILIKTEKKESWKKKKKKESFVWKQVLSETSTIKTTRKSVRVIAKDH